MKKLLIIFLAIVPSICFAQIRRPPVDTSIWCQILPHTCQDGETRRVAPAGPPIDPYAGSYMLPRGISVIQLAFEPEPISPPRTAHMTAYEFMDEVLLEGFVGIKLWLDAVPFEGMGEWCWDTYWGSEQCADYNLDGIDMQRFWESIPDGVVVFMRPQSSAWTWTHGNPCTEGDADSPGMALADYYAITKRLFEIIGDHNIQVVLTDWEQDWQSCQVANGGQEFLLRIIEQRQRDVKMARREAWIKAGHRPKLEVYHAVIVDKYPGNAPDWEWPYLTEMIPTLENRPDFIGLSYWLQNEDPIDMLEWIRETTGYPPHRIYIDELGANEKLQPKRFLETIPLIMEWGVHTVNIWLWKQTWCAAPEKANKGLWKQQQPCYGKVVFTEPTDGLKTLREMMR